MSEIGYFWNARKWLGMEKKRWKQVKSLTAGFFFVRSENFYCIPLCKNVSVIKQNALLFHLLCVVRRSIKLNNLATHFFKQIRNPEIIIMTYFYSFNIFSLLFHECRQYARKGYSKYEKTLSLPSRSGIQKTEIKKKNCYNS